MTIGTYLSNIAVEGDVFLNVVTGGEPGDSVSLRLAKANHAGGKKACLLCKWLSLTVAKNHCDNTLAGLPTPTMGKILASVQFGIALTAIGVAIHWIWRMI